MEIIEKIVEFDKYCPSCVHKDEANCYFDDKGKPGPCEECLSSPVNDYSHKPINYEEKA